ncbi:MAG: family 10 glycosylhydrolase [Fimbriimonadaceae bacterium]|nr:family 10 glycosylhydrolase [Fimbriimonadaceae bacterium]
MLSVVLVSAMALLQPSTPAVPREFRAAWVATVDNIDWPSKRDLTTQQQQAELQAIIDKAKELNLNALIFQVRPSADALYESKLEPWSEYLTGQQGKAPSPFWDPLKFAVEKCHEKGIELHAWFNPYRAKHPSMKGQCDPSHIAKTNPGLVKSYSTLLWMDPGEPAVQKRSMDVMMDVVKRYDIDGVHIDDYFYPYPVKSGGKNVPFPDSASYAKYQKAGGKLKVDDWRRKNVDDFIEGLYKAIKKEKSWVKFGISPFGIYRPGVPQGIKAGIDQYAELYADAKKWFNNGWCDYMTPQLYWAIGQKEQAYKDLQDWWIGENTKGRHLWVGNYTSRLVTGAGGWQAQELIDQIEATRGSKATGNVHFSMKALMRDAKGIATALKNGPYKEPALVPESPWLKGRPGS